MSIVVRFNPTNVTSEKYEESLKRLKEAGQWPPDARGDAGGPGT